MGGRGGEWGGGGRLQRGNAIIFTLGTLRVNCRSDGDIELIVILTF